MHRNIRKMQRLGPLVSVVVFQLGLLIRHMRIMPNIGHRLPPNMHRVDGIIWDQYHSHNFPHLEWLVVICIISRMTLLQITALSRAQDINAMPDKMLLGLQVSPSGIFLPFRTLFQI